MMTFFKIKHNLLLIMNSFVIYFTLQWTTYENIMFDHISHTHIRDISRASRGKK